MDAKMIDEYESHLVGSIPEVTDDVIMIAIAGGSGSGKTALAQAIYDAIGPENITFISHDSYYKDHSNMPIEEREKLNFDHPDALETSLLIQHLTQIRQGQNVLKPEYDFATHSRKKEFVEIGPRPVILVEGILILSYTELNPLFDIRVYVDTDDDIRLIRRLQRDTVERGRSLEGIIKQYLTTVRPMHLEFVEPSKRHAHIIVPVGLNSVALDLVVSRLQASIRMYKRHRNVNSNSLKNGDNKNNNNNGVDDNGNFNRSNSEDRNLDSSNKRHLEEQDAIVCSKKSI